MDLDASGNNPDGGTNPKHIPFHRRGGEKYSLHLGHRPPKLQKQQSDKKRARQQQLLLQEQAQEDIDALQEVVNAQNSENNEISQDIQDTGGVDIINNGGIPVSHDNTIITPTQPADPVAQQGNILPDNASEQAQQTQVQVQQQVTEAPKSILSELLLGDDSPPKRDPFSCEGMMARIQQDGIQLVAFDFDKSILDIHTKGKWKGPASDLVPHVRPDMKCLIRNCRERGIHVAVATFSTQKDLIQEVLQEALGYTRTEQQKVPDTGPGDVNQDSPTANDAGDSSNHLFTGPYIPVYGRDDVVEGSNKGKQSQLLLAMEAINRQTKITMADIPVLVEGETAQLQQQEDAGEHTNKDGEKQLASTTAPALITAASTLLVDDDRRNIQIAMEDGYRTILFRPDDALTKAAPAVPAAEAAVEEGAVHHQLR